MRFHVDNREKTHCPQGHEYTEENTVRWPSQPGSRRCKRCQYQRSHDKWMEIGPPGRRAIHLRAKYGITPEQYDAMFAAQEGLCALCRRAEATRVDHDHETGVVRSLLCHPCNAGIGFFHEDGAVLLLAIAYLEAHA
jgi:hypothetical protein